MKNVAAVLLLASLVALVSTGRIARDNKYTTKYDNIDVDQILRSERLIKNYHDCLTDKGPCTPEGSELKKNIPDALQNACTKCSEKQKAQAEKVIRYLIDKKPALWKELEDKWDKTGEYRKKYEAETKKYGITV